MGGSQSKLNIFLPDEILCFPSYFNEEQLFETVQKIEECHSQAIKFAAWISSFIVAAPVTPIGQVAFTGATILFTFLIHRLSPYLPNLANDTSSASNNNAAAPAETNLEDALIDAKVSSAIAKKSVCELQAKICVINNRYQRLLSDISLEDRRLEVVPALQTCEEVLQLFHDPTHVFRLNPLVSSPFLAPFSGVFVAVAELSLVLIPSYKGPLIAELSLLKDTLIAYKMACVKTRLESLSFRSVQPESMLDAVANGMAEKNFRMEDAYLEKSRKARNPSTTHQASNTPGGRDDNNMDNFYHNANEAIAAYRSKLQDEYDRFFGPGLEAISKFSGFQPANQ